jgi:uncharacterized protein YbjT (DUF2867 family)
MTKQTILVTGASGNVASQLIPLLKSNPDVTVRALVRDAQKGKKLGVDFHVGDLSKPRTLDKAFQGVTTLMSIVPNGPLGPQQASSALWAARQAGVKRVVRLSAIGAAHDAPTVNSRLHALSDHEYAVSGLAYTIMKPHFFMQNFFASAQSIAAEGAFYMALGDSKMSTIDVADVAAFAAKVLTTEGHEGKTYTPTGPKSISMHEVAAAFSEALGKPVKYVAVPFEAAEQGMAKAGLDEYTCAVYGDYFRAYASGWGDFVNDDFVRVVGRPARSFSEFARSVAPAFGKK